MVNPATEPLYKTVPPAKELPAAPAAVPSVGGVKVFVLLYSTTILLLLALEVAVKSISVGETAVAVKEPGFSTLAALK